VTGGVSMGAILFASECPGCKDAQPQEYSVASLARLLNGGHPIEAYCAACQGFWIISCQKRAELAEAVAVACGSRPPQEQVAAKTDAVSDLGLQD
jgi:hypothetical protein